MGCGASAQKPPPDAPIVRKASPADAGDFPRSPSPVRPSRIALSAGSLPLASPSAEGAPILVELSVGGSLAACAPSSAAAHAAEASGSPTKTPPATPPKPNGGDWDDWDEDSPAPSRASAAVTRPSPLANGGSAPVPKPTELACSRSFGATVIGGSALDESLEAPLSCAHCGHPVTRFSGHRWDASTDYFHCRNFAPDARMPQRRQADLAKLSTRLVADGAFAAYACACSWQSLDGEKQLEALGTPAAPHGGGQAQGESAEQMVTWRAPT